MIFITGDTHGDQGRFDRFGAISKGDTLIVCGDFGYIYKNNLIEKMFLDELEKKEYNICFCCGNHENFDALEKYGIEEWNGGKVHRIRNNIFHLMRGQIYSIEGKKIFSFGGAYSIDRYMGPEHVYWWSQEIPCNEEYGEATQNLKRHNYKVDYIVTHTAPQKIIMEMRYYPDRHDAELTGFLEWIRCEVSYEQWFFGHWHKDEQIDEKHRALWFDIEKR